MFTNRLSYLLTMIILIVVPACAPVATQMSDEPVTLRFAIADAEERPSTPYVLEFVDQVKTLSNGSVTIEPVWDAGAPTEAGFEVGVVQIVKEGQADLGLAGSRAFDVEGITSFQALQAPFLITSDNLSKAVATSDIATQMLDSLPSAGCCGFDNVAGRPAPSLLCCA
jgi:TRAP-type C4-dicarboxylate transport system substrate-binding protein